MSEIIRCLMGAENPVNVLLPYNFRYSATFKTHKNRLKLIRLKRKEIRPAQELLY
jgi:hypothetical protein